MYCSTQLLFALYFMFMDNKEKKHVHDIWNLLPRLGHTSQGKGTVLYENGLTTNTGHKVMGP